MHESQLTGPCSISIPRCSRSQETLFPIPLLRAPKEDKSPDSQPIPHYLLLISSLRIPMAHVTARQFALALPAFLESIRTFIHWRKERGLQIRAHWLPRWIGVLLSSEDGERGHQFTLHKGALVLREGTSMSLFIDAPVPQGMSTSPSREPHQCCPQLGAYLECVLWCFMRAELSPKPFPQSVHL